MGGQGNQESAEAEVVLDAGALISFERGDRRMRALAFGASEAQIALVIPASVLAQVWRGGPRSAALAHLIFAADIDSLDEVRAKEVGERLGRRNAADIADAHVVCCALNHRAAIITSDRNDIEALADSDEHLTLVSV